VDRRSFPGLFTSLYLLFAMIAKKDIWQDDGLR